MLYNNGSFGNIVDVLSDSLFTEDYISGSITPPPSSSFLLDNTGEILFDNSFNPLLDN